MTKALRRGAAILIHNRPTCPWFEDATTVDEHIAAYARHSRFPFWEVNTDLGFPPALAQVPVAAVVLHYSIFHTAGYHFDAGFRRFLRETDAYKVAFFQDEHHFCQQRFLFLNEHHVDCVFTCLEESEFDAVYRRYTNVPTLVSNFPGYVSEEMIRAAQQFALPDSERPVDIGYRGRALAPYGGRAALEKAQVAAGFADAAEEQGLVFDVTAREGERLYGDDWSRFMGSCKGTLGTEAGVSVFDLEDRAYAEYVRQIRAGGPVTIETLERGPQGDLEGAVYYRTISPRHFEAAAFRVCQILFEGRYSGVLEPMVHYLPLKKDFSNAADVLSRFKDPAIRRELTDNTHRDLIASGRYGYATLMQKLDLVLERAGLEPTLASSEVESITATLELGRRRRQLATRLRWEWLRARLGVTRRIKRLKPSQCRERVDELAEWA